MKGSGTCCVLRKVIEPEVSNRLGKGVFQHMQSSRHK